MGVVGMHNDFTLFSRKVPSWKTVVLLHGNRKGIEIKRFDGTTESLEYGELFLRFRKRDGFLMTRPKGNIVVVKTKAQDREQVTGNNDKRRRPSGYLSGRLFIFRECKYLALMCYLYYSCSCQYLIFFLSNPILFLLMRWWSSDYEYFIIVYFFL